jgi:hypothetical protein
MKTKILFFAAMAIALQSCTWPKSMTITQIDLSKKGKVYYVAHGGCHTIAFVDSVNVYSVGDTIYPHDHFVVKPYKGEKSGSNSLHQP